MRRSFLGQALLLAVKDLKVYGNDRSALLFSLVFPFLFVIIFSAIMGNPTGGDQIMTVYVATAETEADSISRQIIDGMSADDTGFAVKELAVSAARSALADRRIDGYLCFPEDFTRNIHSNTETGLTVFYDPEASKTRMALVSIARTIAAEIVSYRITYQVFMELAAGPGLTGRIPAAGLPDGTRAERNAGNRPEIVLDYEKVGDVEPVGAADFLLPGYLTMFIFFALALTAESIIGEKENFTLERLLAGGVGRLAIVAGKYLSSFGRGLIQVVTFWTAGVLIFRVNMGKYPAAVITISVLMAVAAAGIGVFLATVARSRKGAASLGVFVSLSAAAFGGSWWPLFIMPQWLQNAARITPHAWANAAFNKLMLFGAAPVEVIPEMAALTAFGLLFMCLGVIRFRVE